MSNWYKTSNLSYMSIGHDPSKGKPTYLWWWDGSFHVQPTEDPGWGHFEAIPRDADVICEGRYDPSQNIASIQQVKIIDQGQLRR